MHTDLPLEPDSLFDVQVKRIHEYKRQHLNILHVIALYHRSKNGVASDFVPAHVHLRRQGRAGLPHGEADHQAHQLGGRRPEPRSADARTAPGRVPAELQRDATASASIPAADLSEQISTAGKEASGTGNMKFAMNGALTIGTLDGANIEMRDEVGAENFFLFGLTAPEVEALRAQRLPSGRLVSCGRRSRERRRADPCRLLLARRHGAVRAAAAQPVRLRPVLRVRRFRRIPRLPEPSRGCLSRSRPLDAHVDREHGPHRQVLVGSHDPLLLPRHLARPPRARRPHPRPAPHLTRRRDARGHRTKALE